MDIIFPIVLITILLVICLGLDIQLPIGRIFGQPTYSPAGQTIYQSLQEKDMWTIDITGGEYPTISIINGPIRIITNRPWPDTDNITLDSRQLYPGCITRDDYRRIIREARLIAGPKNQARLNESLAKIITDGEKT